MKILWFTTNSAIYAANSPYCGWIGALQKEILNLSNVILAIACPWNSDFKEKRNDVLYYGVQKYKLPIFNYHRKQSKQIERLRSVVEDFQPDVIHVFGSENGFGMVCEVTNIPVVIHIQGILGAWFETFMPYNLSWLDYLLKYPLVYIAYDAWKKYIDRERQIFMKCKYFMGRTQWDKDVTKLLSPQAEYFHCEEMIRSDFYQASAWQYRQKDSLLFVTTISNPTYKGVDVILRTAKLLRRESNMRFRWKVFGVKDIRWAERLTNINAKDVGVDLEGVVDAHTLLSNLHEANIYIHPSYIENSSNAICEAQCVGVPLIATNVGGTSSLVENEKTGILVPANDVYFLSAQILRLASNIDLCKKIGRQAREVALRRHNPQQIINTLMDIYRAMVVESDE